jgi:hypothetical protein
VASTQRYRTGRISEVKGKVKVGVLAEVGDLVALLAGKVETFTSAALTSANFRTNFLGLLAEGATRGTETADTACLVYTECEAELPLSAPAAAVVDVGGLVKATADQIVATGGVLGVAGTGDAIGRLARTVQIGDTSALVKLTSVVALGGPQPLT